MSVVRSWTQAALRREMSGTKRRRRPWVGLVAVAVAVGSLAACTTSDPRPPGGTAPASTDAPTTSVGPGQDQATVMRRVGTTVIAPAYRHLATAAVDLGAATAACDLDRSKAALRAARLAYDRSYAGQTFSPMELRRLLQSIEFWPTDPEKIEALLAGTDPVTVEALNALGARLKGLPGIEAVLFGGGPLTGRRCQMAAAQSAIVRQSTETVATGWEALAPTLEGNTTVVGSFVSSLVSAVGLVEGVQLGVPAGLRRGIPVNPRNVRGRMALEDASATLAGAQAAVDAGVVPLVSADLGARLQDAGRAGAASITRIPEPLQEAILTSAPTIEAAQETIKLLELLLTTEVIGSLGLTLSFPSDGD